MFFGLAIIYYQVCYAPIKIHISSKPSTRVTKKYHNINGNYNNSQLEFEKKKKYHNIQKIGFELRTQQPMHIQKIS